MREGGVVLCVQSEEKLPRNWLEINLIRNSSVDKLLKPNKQQ